MNPLPAGDMGVFEQEPLSKIHEIWLHRCTLLTGVYHGDCDRDYPFLIASSVHRLIQESRELPQLENGALEKLGCRP